jgi:hypothetical protein
MKTHKVGSLDVRFTGRRTWKAVVRRGGEVIADDAPVAWDRDRHRDPETGEFFQDVCFRNRDEALKYNELREPFVIAVITAKDYSVLPHEFEEFRNVLEVVSTGRVLNDSKTGKAGFNSIQTKVIKSFR